MTVVLTQLDYEKQILNYLRWKLTDPKARGSTATETFNGTGSALTFTVAQKAAKYIGAVTIGGVAQQYLKDFTFDLKNDGTYATVTFRTAPAVGTDNVSITYGYGSTWIYPFTPEENSVFPIISFKPVTKRSSYLAMGNPGRWYKPVYQIGVHVRRDVSYTIGGKTYVGNELVAYLADVISTTLLYNGINDLYACMKINHDDSMILPYDKENRITAEVDTYGFTFEQRWT